MSLTPSDQSPALAAQPSGTKIQGCKNVPESRRVDDYITNAYLTTFGSAFLEGSANGFSEGLGAQGQWTDAVRKAMLHPKVAPDGALLELPLAIQPYCRSYYADRPAVARAVAEILPSLGNKILQSDQQAGIFRTDVIDRQSPAARWKDSYIITVSSEGPERVVVRILRTIYICRDGVTYNQGLSSGHNETWIFTRIADRLAVGSTAP